MPQTYIVALNSFSTGARSYYAYGRYVGFKREAQTMTQDAAIALAVSEGDRIGRSVLMEVVEYDAAQPWKGGN